MSIYTDDAAIYRSLNDVAGGTAELFVKSVSRPRVVCGIHFIFVRLFILS